ncbi:MAG: hypothetical protein IJ680_01260 [Paludibacteraceae bacterium]|nr:protoporphyrinogen oxidase [Eubacterium sp.]MBR1630462.1 hypothetical protein [Paludibacteraceae bacterium]
MPDNKAKQNLVDSKTIAMIFDMGVRNVQLLAQEGTITAIKKGNANKYDLLPTIKQYIKYLKEKANGRQESSKDAEQESIKLKAEADLKRSKADMAELQLKELRGEMHRSEDVEAVMTDLIYTIRSMLTALPGRLAVDVAGAATPAEASEIIRAEVYKVLEELAGYKYDPEEYARRVRDREGWRELANGGDDE